MEPKTLFDKIWRDHLVEEQEGGTCLVYIDRHLVHEVTSPQAFEGLRNANRSVRRPDCTLVTCDHNVPTDKRGEAPVEVSEFIKEEASKLQVMTLEQNVKDYELTYWGMNDARQGIVHVVGPEQGFTLPGTTMVCGDSHTSTHGALGALAFGIGTSEVEHVLATQSLIMKKPRNMRVEVNGALGLGVGSKDVVLHVIGKLGTAGGTGHVIEFCGTAVEAMSMEARMSMCNMSIEAGARAGLVAPDAITLEYIRGRPMAPQGADWEKAVAYWNSLRTDEGAVYDTTIVLDAADIAPTVTWGTSPQDVAAITDTVPDPAQEPDEHRSAAMSRSLAYMGLEPGTPLSSVKIDKVFIGSCTNSRIEDLRAVAAVVKGKKVAEHVYAMVVPGSGLVKQQAEEEGLAQVLLEAGFDWREPGCSMCLGMNPDKLKPQERCASTSNRNFEGRQGPGGRTHLMSPAMAAAAAVEGKLTDVREGNAAGSTALPISEPGSTDGCPEWTFSPAEQAGEAGVSSAGMPPFTVLSSVAAWIDLENIDTDMIIPAKFLKTIKRTGLGVSCFNNMRYNEDGSPIEDFVFHQPQYKGSQILVTGTNFGCGSSREHAPWALNDLGVQCIIAPSFADIFFNNCFKNGMLPVVLPLDQVRTLMEAAKRAEELCVDLEAQTIMHTASGDVYPFEVDPFRKHCLLNGLDDIGLTLMKQGLLSQFEQQRGQVLPWMDNVATSEAARTPVPCKKGGCGCSENSSW